MAVEYCDRKISGANSQLTSRLNSIHGEGQQAHIGIAVTVYAPFLPLNDEMMPVASGCTCGGQQATLATHMGLHVAGRHLEHHLDQHTIVKVCFRIFDICHSELILRR